MARTRGFVTMHAVVVLMSVILYTLSLIVPARAAASADPYGYNYAGQFTSTSNGSLQIDSTHWSGVSGGIYWGNHPFLTTDLGPVHVASYLDCGDNHYFSSWVQAGYIEVLQENGYNPGAALYLENMVELNSTTNEHHYFSYLMAPPITIPSHEWFQIYFSGNRSPSNGMYMWTVYTGAGTYRPYNYTWSATCFAEATSEAYNYGFLNWFPSAYFGTDRAGYRTDGSHRVLLRGPGWWGTWGDPIAWGGTTIGSWAGGIGGSRADPPYHYSPGYHYYYFGTWND